LGEQVVAPKIMKSFLPWLVAALALGGAYFFYASGKSKSGELARVQQELDELESLRAENAELKTNLAAGEELERLRKDNRDLLRLRNKVHQLRNEKQQLTQQAATAQADVQRAQAQARAAQLQVQTFATNTPPAGQPVSPEMMAAFQRRYGLSPQPQGTALMGYQALANACIHNLRPLDGAKQRWALENRKTQTAIPTEQEIAVYLSSKTIPKCPAGGTSTLNSVAANPTCSVQGHVLPQSLCPSGARLVTTLHRARALLGAEN
jgi:hypothetical protein